MWQNDRFTEIITISDIQNIIIRFHCLSRANFVLPQVIFYHRKRYISRKNLIGGEIWNYHQSHKMYFWMKSNFRLSFVQTLIDQCNIQFSPFEERLLRNFKSYYLNKYILSYFFSFRFPIEVIRYEYKSNCNHYRVAYDLFFFFWLAIYLREFQIVYKFNANVCVEHNSWEVTEMRQK